MVAIIIGFLLICFTVWASLSSGLNWGDQIVLFLKGASPVVAAFIGLIAIWIGIADIKDLKEAQREEEEARKAEESAKKG